MYTFEMYINQFDVHHTLQHAASIDAYISNNNPSPPNHVATEFLVDPGLLFPSLSIQFVEKIIPGSTELLVDPGEFLVDPKEFLVDPVDPGKFLVDPGLLFSFTRL